MTNGYEASWPKGRSVSRWSLTYRGAPLDGAERALVGTMEHGGLGRRWAHDGCHEPVLVAQLLALIEGRVQAQDQNTSDTPDREVTRSSIGDDLGATAFTTPPTTTRAPNGLRRMVPPSACTGP